MSKVAFTPIVGNARGKVGNTVFTKARNGATIRIRVKPLNPRSSGQQSVRSYLAAASRAFKALSASDLGEWENYAAGLTYVNPVSGQSYHPAAINIFNKLSVKFLQVTPAGTIPSTPPATPFTGDAVTVAATADTDSITWTASGANGAGIKTECLYQLLPSANRKPSATGYKSAGFYAAAGGSLTNDVTLDAGIYATAYRFVKTATGEATPLVVGEVVTVG